MTQPYAVAGEILWLAWLDEGNDGKKSYTMPQVKKKKQKKTWKHAPIC